MEEEEHRTVVVDLGSLWTKCGWAGDDKPLAKFITVVGTDKGGNVTVGDESAENLVYPVRHREVKDWNDMWVLLWYLFEKEMKVDPNTVSVLVSIPPYLDKTSCEGMAKLLLEDFQVLGITLQTNGELDLYSSGRTTGLVVHVGADVTSVMPFYDSYLFTNAIQQQRLGGEDITRFLHSAIKSKKTISPATVRKMKESLCYVAQDREAEQNNFEENPSRCERSFECPDGSLVSLGKERFLCPEVLFDPTLINSGCHPLVDLIAGSIMLCSADVRGELMKNVLLFGGSTQFEGFRDRVEQELARRMPPGARIKVVHQPDCWIGGWIGGSILASLSIFRNERILSRDMLSHCPNHLYHGVSQTYDSSLLLQDKWNIAPRLVGGDYKNMFVGDEAQSRRGVLDLTYPLAAKTVDWNCFEKIFHSMVYNELRICPDEYCFLITGRLMETEHTKNELLKICFEHFNIPAVQVLDQTLLALYSFGNKEGIVVHSGHLGTEVVPWSNLDIGGEIASGGLKVEIPFGGRDVTNALSNVMINALQSPFSTSANQEIIREIKEQLCYVKVGDKQDEKIPKEYELRDGSIITLTSERWKVIENLFIAESEGGFDLAGAVLKSVEGCDAETRSKLLENIVLVGGNTMFEGFAARLESDLKKKTAALTKVVAVPKRNSLSWIGGNKLMSQERFQQFLFGRQSYDECGSEGCQKPRVGLGGKEAKRDDDVGVWPITIDFGSGMIKVSLGGHDSVPSLVFSSIVGVTSLNYGQLAKSYGRDLRKIFDWNSPDERLRFNYRQLRGLAGVSTFFDDVENAKMRSLYVDALVDGSAPFGRSRLVIGGEGRAGKSALVRSLLGKPFEANLESTIGADTTQSVTLERNNVVVNWSERPSDEEEFRRHAAECVATRFLTSLRMENPRKSSESKSQASETEMKPPSQAANLAAQSIEPEKRETIKKNKDKTEVNQSNLAPSLPNRTSKRLSQDMRRSSKTIGSLFNGRGKDKAKPQASVTLEHPKPVRLEQTDDVMSKFDASLVMEYKDALEKNQRSVTFSIWDLGGQKVFYSLHHAFLSRCSVYLVVFDMRKILDESLRAPALGFLEHWLHSIALHAYGAPIFLVGTHKDEVFDHKQFREINTYLCESIVSKQSKFFQFLVRNDEDHLSFWPVDNTLSSAQVVIHDQTVERLREEIERAVSAEKYIYSEIPIAWTRMVDKLLETKERHVSLDFAETVGKQCGIREPKQLEAALALFHELGLVLYFRDTDELRRVVILDPQWLVNAFGMVIRDFALHPYSDQMMNDLEYDHWSDFKTLRDEGIASRDLLEFLWQSEEEDKTDYTRRKFLLSLMERMSLLCTWRRNYHVQPNSIASETVQVAGGTEVPASHFMIPSLFRLQKLENPETIARQEQIEDEVPENLQRECEDGGEEFYFDFSQTFLPAGVFERLICLTVDHARSAAFNESRVPVLAPHDVLLSFGDLDFRMTELVSLRRIRVITAEDVPARPLLLELESIMCKIDEEIMHGRLEFETVILVHQENKARKAEVSFKVAETGWANKAKLIRAKDGRRIKLKEVRPWMIEESGDPNLLGEDIGR